MQYKSGFAGDDHMRNKAEREFRSEMNGLDMHVPESTTSRSRMKMRMYKKGGHVHGLNHGQSDLHIPRRVTGKAQGQKLFSKVEHKAAGGELGRMATRDFKAGERAVGLKKHGGRVRKDMGGLLGDVGNMAQNGFNNAKNAFNTAKPGITAGLNAASPYVNAASPMLGLGLSGARAATGLKRGGKAKYAHGGKVHGQNDEPRLLKGEPMRKGFHSADGLKRGGHAHRKHKMDGGTLMDMARNAVSPLQSRMMGTGINAPGARPLLPTSMGQQRGFKHGGKAQHKSEGGPMRGEHPSHHLVKNNYESDMRGEKAVRKAKGGACYAAGGVGKMRHGEATKRGQQVGTRHPVKRGGGC